MRKYIYSPDFGILLFRVFIGFTMAFAHGLGKFPPGEQIVGGIGGMGFPAPLFFAWCLAFSEFAGGILIGIGLCARYAAFFMGFSMSVAAFVAHGADPFAKKEMALLYLAACVLIFFQGAGRYSLDRIIRKK